jgi:hypothetical protein
MGKAVWGTSGGFQGKNGANIGRWLDGQNIVGPLPHPSQIPPTIAQLNQRAIFGMLTSWLRIIKLIIRSGFNIAGERGSPWTAAVSYNLRNAVTGVAPNFAIDYPKVVFCKGQLSTPTDWSVSSGTGAALEFEWSKEFNVGAGADTDKVTFVTYNPTRGSFIFLMGAATRVQESYSLQMPLTFAGDTVHCWMSFLSADGKVSSNSIYIGIAVVV